jgi:hypothetical protein
MQQLVETNPNAESTRIAIQQRLCRFDSDEAVVDHCIAGLVEWIGVECALRYAPRLPHPSGPRVLTDEPPSTPSTPLTLAVSFAIALGDVWADSSMKNQLAITTLSSLISRFRTPGAKDAHAAAYFLVFAIQNERRWQPLFDRVAMFLDSALYARVRSSTTSDEVVDAIRAMELP